MKTCEKLHSYPKELKCCPECKKASNKAWYETNKEQVKARAKAYSKANPAKMNAKNAKRHTAKLQAIPPWITPAQLQSIELFYQAASWVQSILEEPIEVDHIVPLQGKDVCGLHVPWNLQLLPAALNRSKGNKT